jgi:hypothetical protein
MNLIRGTERVQSMRCHAIPAAGESLVLQNDCRMREYACCHLRNLLVNTNYEQSRSRGSHIGALALWRHNLVGHMRALIVASMLIAGYSFAPMAMDKMSRADCQAIWKSADVNGNGKMDGLEAKPFIDAMIAAQEKAVGSQGKSLPSGEFLKSCEAGTIRQREDLHNI